ncbi:MAG: polysaccharide pyruvyl transferase family protein [Pseudanabaena sp. CAN_BIN31]|nr:polysaccharide pyruvyl transferase family protein [Pseudanabaena sp. CAN_BIN31]
MKILIDHGGYPVLNIGDLAMLQVAIQRLCGLWSNPSIQVFTTSPEKLAKYCPNTTPLLPSGRNTWLSTLVSPAYKIPSRGFVQLWSNWEDHLRRQSPEIVRSFIELKLKLKGNSSELASDFQVFMEAFHEADLVIACGGGYITDSFKYHASGVLDTLDLANSIGKPIAMFGQGLGPLRDPDLRAKARAVLPKAKLISLREQRSGIPILKSFNISSDRFIVTGDDAIEMSYQKRNPNTGDGIGINLRIANYANIDADLIETVRTTLQDAAKSLSAPLIPVPISLKAEGKELSDSMAIRELLKGYDDASDGGQLIDTPHKVIEQIGLCRVVVTGSYHAGVFALAQGIPVVCLAKSEYYADKFLGLADQFGVGCQVIFMNNQQLKENLLAAIFQSWNDSEQLRLQLLAAAEHQISLGRTAYKNLYDMI